MIHYDTKYIIKKLILTFMKSQLEFIGPYNLWVCNKAVVKVDVDGLPQCILEVETEDKVYKGMIPVSDAEYEQAKRGKVWVKGGVIRHKRIREYYVMTKYSDPKKALRKEVNSSRLQILFILVVLVLLIELFIAILTPFFSTL